MLQKGDQKIPNVENKKEMKISRITVLKVQDRSLFEAERICDEAIFDHIVTFSTAHTLSSLLYSLFTLKLCQAGTATSKSSRYFFKKLKKRLFGPQSPFSISSSFTLSFFLLPFFLHTKMNNSFHLTLCSLPWFRKQDECTHTHTHTHQRKKEAQHVRC